MEEFTDSMWKIYFCVWLFLAASIGHMLNASQKWYIYMLYIRNTLDVEIFMMV